MKNIISEVLYVGIGTISKLVQQYQQAETAWYSEGEKKVCEWENALLQRIEHVLTSTGVLRPEQMPDVNTWEE